MINFLVKHTYNDLFDVEHQINNTHNFDEHHIKLIFKEDMVVDEHTIKIGYFVDGKPKENSFIMTHEQSVLEAQMPFAFPALVAKIDNDTQIDLLMVSDYYMTSSHFRYFSKKSYFYGVYNQRFSAVKGQVVDIHMHTKQVRQSKHKLTELIGQCATEILDMMHYEDVFNHDDSYQIKKYEDAVFGLDRDLLDPRSRIHDGVGTFIPYCYLEDNPYSESFVAMGVAHGMYPYAKLTHNHKMESFINETLNLMTDQSAKYKWIDDAHNTQGFFHLAWGSIPDNPGTKQDYKDLIGLFTDFDGHEEGPNLLSTWKYFYRVQVLGELALMSNEKQVIDGFLKTVPFVNKLKMDGYYQPVTYDLDTHLPVTGKTNGGSAGGIAFWSLIHFTAYLITKDKWYLTEALNALEAAETLDFNQYLSMRQAPKPVTVGWLTKSHVIAYELTSDEKYLKRAEKISQSIYFFYYISPHPYTYFSTLGFGYACARERWEAFLEMVDSLYGLSYFIKYTKDTTLHKLFALARQHILWALPLNGNPYGNLSRPYDSIGGTYVPYEFSTGSMGDNPGLDGGSQSSSRQIKEIYGSGQLYLAYMMFELNAFSSQKNVLVLKHAQFDMSEEQLGFNVYNYSNHTTKTVLAFNHLTAPSYEIEGLYENTKVMSKEALMLGIALKLEASEIKQIYLKAVQTQVDLKQYHHLNIEINHDGFESVTIKWSQPNESVTHYVVSIDNDIETQNYFTLEPKLELDLNRELAYKIKIEAITDSEVIVDSYQLKQQLKEIEYALDFNHSITDLFNAELIEDGHMMMFYGINPDVGSMQATIDLKQTHMQNKILSFTIASMNALCSWHAKLIHSKGTMDLAHNQINTGKVEYPFEEDIIAEKLIITIEGTKGLGFSLGSLEILETIDMKQNVLIEGSKFTKLSDGYQMHINSGKMPYIEILIDGLEIGQEVRFYKNNSELITHVESKHQDRIYRASNGVYKFYILDDHTWELKIKTNSINNIVKLCRFTQSMSYQKITDYGRCLEEKNGK